DLREPDRDADEAAPPAHPGELVAAAATRRHDEHTPDHANPVGGSVPGECRHGRCETACPGTTLAPRVVAVLETGQPQHFRARGNGGRLGHPLSLPRPPPIPVRDAWPPPAAAPSWPRTSRAGTRR